MREVMATDPITVHPNASLADADQLCHAKGFHHLPVVDDAGELVGILSDRDLRRGLGAGVDTGGTAGSLMTRRLTTIDADASLAEAAQLMVEHKVSALPVRADPMGLVTTNDVLDFATAVLRSGTGAA